MIITKALKEFRDAAEAVCRLWQRLLRLEDWDVEVKVLRYYDLGEDTTATMNQFPLKKDAVLRLIDPRDHNPRWKPVDSVETDIVHELLHLHFGPLSDRENDAKQVAEEQAVNAISRALVAAAQQLNGSTAQRK